MNNTISTIKTYLSHNTGTAFRWLVPVVVLDTTITAVGISYGLITTAGPLTAVLFNLSGVVVGSLLRVLLVSLAGAAVSNHRREWMPWVIVPHVALLEWHIVMLAMTMSGGSL